VAAVSATVTVAIAVIVATAGIVVRAKAPKKP
jgi:hypothetical protein